MCGIAGISANRSVCPELLKPCLEAMAEAMHHRGPDDGGVVTTAVTEKGLVGLANQRLAILDLSSAGHQPMHDPLTGNWIVLNGEIYNHWEVRQQLGNNSHWRSTSDTETVLRAYARWGAECLAKLRGMFALAIYDSAQDKLWCARDRFGIKPLYFATVERGIVFASEVRTLLQSGWVSGVIDNGGLASFVRYGSISEPATMVRQIESLAAGCYIEIRGGAISSKRQYWSLDFKEEAQSKFATKKTGLRRHLERAVGEHLLADVPVASFLSGGVDSSIVTALAARQSTRPIRTFTICLPGSPLDESRYARKLAELYRTEHHEVLLPLEEVLELVPAAISAMDLPSADGINTYLVSRAVAQTGTKVVLSGLGGDELFGGYRSFHILPMAERWAFVAGPGLRLLGRRQARSRIAEVFGSGQELRERYRSLRSFWSSDELQAMDVELQSFASRAERAAASARSLISRLELNEYLRNVLLRDSDYMSMAHSIELRVPFLDHELVSYCLRVGASEHARKGLLVKAAADLLPAMTRCRHKQGFVLPLDAWMRGPLENFVREGLIKLDDSRVLPAINCGRLHKAFVAGQLQWARLWQMVVLGHWLENSKMIQPAPESSAAVFAGRADLP